MRTLRAAVSVLPPLLLGGCFTNELVLDRARMEADVPVPPPAMVPDSAEAGSFHAQFALWTTGLEDSVAPDKFWKRAPVGAQGQLQVVSGPHLRWIFGAGMSNTMSAWTGPAFSVRNSMLRWDVEMLLGLTHLRSRLDGHVRHEYDGVRTSLDSVEDDDESNYFWGQWTLRARAARSGPWAELRFLPAFSWGNLSSPGSDAETIRIRSAVTTVGAGWVQEMRSGFLWTLGVRGIGIEDEMLPQMILSWQMPLGRSKD